MFYMRYQKQVKIKIHDLALLLMVYYAFKNRPKELGECRANGTYSEACAEIDKASDIQIPTKLLYDLVWYFKTGVLERVKFYKYIMPKNYHGMMQRLQGQNRSLFYEDEAGEIIMRDSEDIYPTNEGSNEQR